MEKPNGKTQGNTLCGRCSGPIRARRRLFHIRPQHRHPVPQMPVPPPDRAPLRRLRLPKSPPFAAAPRPESSHHLQSVSRGMYSPARSALSGQLNAHQVAPLLRIDTSPKRRLGNDHHHHSVVDTTYNFSLVRVENSCKNV